MGKYVCFDIGGTNIKYGLINEAAAVLHHGLLDTEAQKGGPQIVEKVKDVIRRYKEKEKISGICISTAGMVDERKGEVFFALPEIIPEYSGTCLKKIIEDYFNIPCEVENDVNCIGLAEATSGAAEGDTSVLVIAVGTGIGGCAVIDGKVYHGYSRSACEIGYLNIDDSDFQTVGSVNTLVKKVAQWKKDEEAQWNGKRIFEEALNGDAECIKAIDEMVFALGKGIANICYVLNPETIVLGGGIMVEEEYLKDRIHTSLRYWLIPAIASKTKIVFAKYQNTAGMLGAFYHFKQRQGMLD